MVFLLSMLPPLAPPFSFTPLDYRASLRQPIYTEAVAGIHPVAEFFNNDVTKKPYGLRA
jgi:hypothetical protein